MSSSSDKSPDKKNKKIRVPFRRNRTKRKRDSDLTRQVKEAEGFEINAEQSQRVVARGDLSRHRTITIRDGDACGENMERGVVVAFRGAYAEVDDGSNIWSCTVRRILRTRLIDERNPVTIGDHVLFHLQDETEGVVRVGVIEQVEPRTGQLRRKSGRRIHTMVANVDQVFIITTARLPNPKPNLIDRYIIAAHAGDITPIICMNKIDLDDDESARELLVRYKKIGYKTICTSATVGTGIDELKELFKDRSSVVAGQSGVGKSSLLNAVQPGLNLRIGDISEQIEKGRHTTSTARLLRLEVGGYVVDTPGVRSFDLSIVPRNEYEAHFVEFVPLVPNCKYADCTHTHEANCAIKSAVENGRIHPMRYESYCQIFKDPGVVS